MKKKFQEFLEQVRHIHRYRIKIAVITPTREQVERLTVFLSKYDIVEMTARLTLVQDRPADFPQITNASVTIFDISTRLGMSPDSLVIAISNLLAIPRAYVRVISADHPHEADETKGLSALSAFRDMIGDKTDTVYFGDEYNRQLYAGLAIIRDMKKPDNAYDPSDAGPVHPVPGWEAEIPTKLPKVGKYGQLLDDVFNGK